MAPLSGPSFFLPDVPSSSHPLPILLRSSSSSSSSSSSPSSSSSHGSAPAAARSIDNGENHLHAKAGSNRDPSLHHLAANRESKHTSEPKPARHPKPRAEFERKSKLSSMLNLGSKAKTKAKKKKSAEQLRNRSRSCGGEERDLRKMHKDLLRDRGTIASSDACTATALIAAYAKCGELHAARDVFEQMRSPDVVAWTALISGYVRNGEGDEALRCFARMKSSGTCPNPLTYVFVLKASGIVGSLRDGEEIEAEIRGRGLLSSKRAAAVLGNALVGMHAKCGAMETAQNLFEELPARDVVTWNTLLTGYVQNGLGDEALKCFAKMMMQEDQAVSPDAVTFVCALKACGLVGCLETGEAIDAEIRRQRLLEQDMVLGTALLDMYCKCGAMEKAREVFDRRLSQRNVVSWSALIAGYARNGLADEALECFEQMKATGIDPNPVTYVSVLKACGMLRSSQLGKDIDAKLRERGSPPKDAVLGTALLDMYARCGELERAREVFGEMIEKNVVAWNALIAGYARHGLADEALNCFAEMKDAGICADERTYVSVLKACGIAGSLEIGEDVDAELRRRPWLWQRNPVLGTALVDMYARCGALEKAQGVLEELPETNPAAWSALIAGYVQHGFDDKALQCFGRMKDAGIRRDTATYISALKACGSVGSLEIGEAIAEEIGSSQKKDGVLGTALLDMYSKCGAPGKAREVFDQLPVQDDVSWNALIAGYGQLGEADAALRAYKLMRDEGVPPNRIGFVLLLNACSHAGLVKEGELLLEEMSACCSLAPTQEHFACLLDLFGRAGHFDKLKAVLAGAPSSSLFCYAPLLHSVLASCRKWRNAELGRWAFDQLAKSGSESAYAYACMGDIYAVSGMQREAPYGIKKAF